MVLVKGRPYGVTQLNTGWSDSVLRKPVLSRRGVPGLLGVRIQLGDLTIIAQIAVVGRGKWRKEGMTRDGVELKPLGNIGLLP